MKSPITISINRTTRESGSRPATAAVTALVFQSLMTYMVLGGILLILFVGMIDASIKEDEMRDTIRRERCSNPIPSLAGYCQSR